MDIFNNPRAFEPMTEPVFWREDKAPHRTGSLRAIVLHGTPDAQNAGHPYGEIAADPWSVICRDLDSRICGEIKQGDTFSRLGIEGEKLTVQRVAKDETGWIFTCTTNERGTI